MSKITPKSSDIDSFKYSTLLSLHYYDIPYHCERLSNLKLYENQYNFIHITPAEFKINNPNISLNIFNENQEQIYTSSNNTPYEVNITELKKNRYAAMKPPKNKYTQLNEILKSFSHTELKEYISNLLINFHCLHLLHLHSIIQSSSYGITFHLPLSISIFGFILFPI